MNEYLRRTLLYFLVLWTLAITGMHTCAFNEAKCVAYNLHPFSLCTLFCSCHPSTSANRFS